MKKKVLLAISMLALSAPAFAAVTQQIAAYGPDAQFTVFANDLPFVELIPLYHCWNGQARMLSTDAACERNSGYVNRGQVGTVADKNQIGANPGQLIPLYRYNRGGNSHLATTAAPGTPQTAGWNLDGVLGYIPVSTDLAD